ncbi:MAG: hypothetical protein K6G42_09295 [Lachnospiraceae bacterium]|nr:hypothetical protein [Lachnospiraceae bacterium]
MPLKVRKSKEKGGKAAVKYFNPPAETLRSRVGGGTVVLTPNIWRRTEEAADTGAAINEGPRPDDNEREPEDGGGMSLFPAIEEGTGAAEPEETITEETSDGTTEAATAQTGEDPWSTNNDPADILVDKPDQSSFLRDFEKPFPEQSLMRPVFETHSYMNGYLDQHSYMGLRYTKFNTDSGRFERKRIQVGFGGYRQLVGKGQLMDESDNTAQASSETPISVSSFDNVVGAIERTRANISSVERRGFFGRLFGRAKAEGTEFGGRYNVLTNNCNDFVVAMAKAAGVDTAVKLHSTVWGPMKAYKNLAEAAGNESPGSGTRIYNGTTISAERKNDILGSFLLEATQAAGRDGLVLTGDPELITLIRKVDSDTIQIQKTMDAIRENENGDQINVDPVIEEASRDVRAALRHNTGKPHINLNILLMQVELAAHQLREADQSDWGNNIRNVSDAELESIMKDTTDAERSTPGNRITEVADRDLFAGYNVLTGSTKGVGELILMASGRGKLISSYRDSGRSPEMDKVQNINEMYNVIRGSAGDRAIPLIERYAADRNYLSTDQVSKMLTISILLGMGLDEAAVAIGSTWGLDSKAADYEKQSEDIREQFFANGDRALRMPQLSNAVRLYQSLKDRVANIRGESPEVEKGEGQQAG